MEFRNFLKHHYPVLIGALALQIIFFGLALHYKSLYLTDSQEYLYQAENIKNHDSLYSWKWQKPFIYQMWTLRTPVYGYLIYLIQQISASHFAVLLVQNVLAFVNFTGLVWLLKDVKLPKKYLHGILFFSLLLFPTRLVYTNMVMSELVLETGLFWAFFCLVKYLQTQNPKWMLLYNILLAFSVLTKPVLVYFWLPNMLFMGYLVWKNRPKILLLQSLIMPVAIATLCFYNQQVTGYFHYTSIKTYNLSDYNTYELLKHLHGIDSAKAIVKKINQTDADYANLEARLKHIEKESFAIIKENIGLYAWLHFRGAINFFLDPGRYDMVNFLPPLQTKTEFGFFNEVRQHGFAGIFNYFSKIPLGLTVYMALIFAANLITALAFAFWAFFIRKQNLAIRIFAVLLMGYMAAAPGPIGCARFKEPVWFLLVFATVFCAEFFRQQKQIIASEKPEKYAASGR
ncbi:ArnT family glycosyltransferase [Adhaeribacter terreus]|uniref:ArnT family glycosyltransferase n=1 Tax=Adhaeribacter terreus TaxID=529703 RepID=A0ABW0EAP5_9BACT